MADRGPQVVELCEYGSAELSEGQLTGGDLARLRALSTRRLAVDSIRAGYRVTAGATVGVIVLDRVRLVIRPKLAVTGAMLVRWLCYALETPIPHQATIRRWATGADGFTQVVAAALLEECRHLLSGGLRRNYVRRERVEPTLRGRLDVVAQATRRFGRLDGLHVSTFERDPEIWENGVCGTALSAAATLVDDDALARPLAEAAARFPAMPRHAAVRALERSRYNRLNAHYRTAHTWARLLLTGGGLSDLLEGHAERDTQAETLLLDMPVLWESVARRLCREAAAPLGGVVVPSADTRAIVTSGDLSRASSFRPDVLVRFPAEVTATGGDLLPVDAKYKTYGSRSVDAGDVHQLLTYISGYTSPALLLHPNAAGNSARTLRTRAPGGELGRIVVLGLDTCQPPEAAIPHLTDVLRTRDGPSKSRART